MNNYVIQKKARERKKLQSLLLWRSCLAKGGVRLDMIVSIFEQASKCGFEKENRKVGVFI